jgi:hypothetical protein
LKINDPEAPRPIYFNYHDIIKHPKVNSQLFKFIRGCDRIFPWRLRNDYHKPQWIEGSMAVYLQTEYGNFIVTKHEITLTKKIEVRTRGNMRTEQVKREQN